MGFIIGSAAIENHSAIPLKYTCDGDDVSPPLAWENAPNQTKSYILIIDDPDAPNGIWTHWILYNLPDNINDLAEGIKTLPKETKVGKNSWGKSSYGGPCPPTGAEHRYFFKIYALDDLLDLPNNVDRQKIEKAMKGHVLAETQFVAKFKR